ncbi:cyclic lactone autoinducer peptide [Clostridium beijerinckii]|nr:cyclic lactone autoinducer peptide [Clostridium beijerinckii]NOW89147.1 cyclic lactone autoinducer peptide [Clostridium beijerinckii]
MNTIKEILIKNLLETSLQYLGKLAVNIAESSASKCCFSGGLYESKFPKELLELEEYG